MLSRIQQWLMVTWEFCTYRPPPSEEELSAMLSSMTTSVNVGWELSRM